MFNEFSTANIQIDKDFSAKLSGYGCINHIPETEIRNSSVVSALGWKIIFFLFHLSPVPWIIYFCSDILRSPLISFLSHVLILSRHWPMYQWRHLRGECLPPRAMFGVLELCFLNCWQAGRIWIVVIPRKRWTWLSGAGLSWLMIADCHWSWTLN